MDLETLKVNERLREFLDLPSLFDHPNKPGVSDQRRSKMVANLLYNGDFSQLRTDGKDYEGDESLVDWTVVFATFFNRLEK